MNTLTVSIVVYRPDEAWLARTLESLRAALRRAVEDGALASACVVLVDNGDGESPFAPRLAVSFGAAPLRAEIIAGHGNVGYGAGNNLAIARHPADFHLIINPDVEMAVDAIRAGLAYLNGNAACAMVTPVATSAAGSPLYLVKSYPAVGALLLRGFAPAFLRRAFADTLAGYDRSDLPFDAPLADARIVSGCFMLVRGEALRGAGGFDPAFFLYFEDFDLSYRISRSAAIARLPQCRIVHGGGGAAKKGLAHIGMFMRSALRFFHRHGWRW